MKKTLIAAALIGITFTANTHAGMITLDPGLFGAGTDVTHAYQGADLYTASIVHGELVLDSAYVKTCNGCKPVVEGTAVFSPTADSGRLFYDATDFEREWQKPNGTSYGSVLLVSFDEPTDYVQVLGSGAGRLNNFVLDYWDAYGHRLGRCNGNTNLDGSSENPNCETTFLGLDPNPYDDQKIYKLRLTDPTIRFVTLGASDGAAYVSSISYNVVPEPAPLLVMSSGLLALAAFRRRKSAG